MYGLGSTTSTCAPNFIEIGAQEHSLHTLLLFGAKKKKLGEENLTSFRDSYLRNCWGYFFQIWHVRYCIIMKTLYVDLVEIGAIVFQL